MACPITQGGHNNNERCRLTTVYINVLMCCWPFLRSARELSLLSPEFFHLSLPVSNLLCHQPLHLLLYGQSANTKDVGQQLHWNILKHKNIKHHKFATKSYATTEIKSLAYWTVNIMNKQLFLVFCIRRKTNIHCRHLRCQLINKQNQQNTV